MKVLRRLVGIAQNDTACRIELERGHAVGSISLFLFHEPCSTLTRATSCQYLKSYPTRTNPRAESSISIMAGISIRDRKGKEYDTIHLVSDRYNLTSSLKEATRKRRQDDKPITDYHMEESTYVWKVTAKQFMSSTRTK